MIKFWPRICKWRFAERNVPLQIESQGQGKTSGPPVPPLSVTQGWPRRFGRTLEGSGRNAAGVWVPR